MSDEQITVVYDLEFYFAEGDPCFVSYVEGRDTYAEDHERIRIEVKEDPESFQETIIQVIGLNYRKVTKRIEEEERRGFEEGEELPPTHRLRRGPLS